MAKWKDYTILGGYKGFFEGKDAETNPYGQLNPEQVDINKKLGSYLSTNMGNTPSLYGGQYTADLTPEEQNVISQNARLSSLAEGGLSNMLSGEFPEEYWQNAVYNPMLKSFKEDIQPQIEEQYAGQWSGTPRASAVAKGYRDLMDTLTAKRAELGWQARNAVPEAVSAMNTMGVTSATLAGMPREIKQYGLDKQYAEYVRGQQEKQNYINQALTFLGVSTGTYTPAEPSIFEQLLPELVKAGGQAAGMAAAA